MSFDEFRDKALSEAYFRRDRGLRLGQSLVNLLSKHRPDLGRHMTADKDYDPFYNDKQIPAFWAWVKENW